MTGKTTQQPVPSGFPAGSRTTTPAASPACTKLVTCMHCAHSRLLRYGGVRNPIIAECHAKPQPWNTRFPYVREVARVHRRCTAFKATLEEKQIEERPKCR